MECFHFSFDSDCISLFLPVTSCYGGGRTGGVILAKLSKVPRCCPVDPQQISSSLRSEFPYNNSAGHFAIDSPGSSSDRAKHLPLVFISFLLSSMLLLYVIYI